MESENLTYWSHRPRPRFNVEGATSRVSIRAKKEKRKKVVEEGDTLLLYGSTVQIQCSIVAWAGVGERLKILPGEQSSALVSHVTSIMSPVDKLNTRESKVSVSYKPISSTD